MTAGELRMPAIVAWVFFAPGVLFVTVDIVRLDITGLFLLGSVFLALWFWLIGGFTRDFWIQPTPTPTGGAASPAPATTPSVAAPPVVPQP